MKWTLKKIPRKISDDSSLHEVVRILLAQRSITEKRAVQSFLHPNYTRDFHDPFLLSDMKKVVDRIIQAKDSHESVGIFGDHDVDGVSATTIMSDGLTLLGINHEAYIPCKHNEGHGLNTTAIDHFADQGITLMITVDCGVSDKEMVLYAKKKGIETIITDHHQIPKDLPEAYAIINPHKPGDSYPFKDLCGAACAFKVVYALIETVMPHECENLKWMLDIVAIATVADCMPLVGENRTFVTYGLIVLAKTRRRSLQELIAVGEMSISPESPPTTHTIGFDIGPRLNAAGRMGHARDAYHFLKETDPAAARFRAEDLEQKNKERRKITEKILKHAQKKIEEDFSKNGEKAFILVSDPTYPIGIVGIVAGRLTRLYGRPVGVFTEEAEIVRGSFRSIPGVNLVAILTEVEDLLDAFGGHEAAAGASFKEENVPSFVERTSQITKDLGFTTKDTDHVEADAQIMSTDISSEFVDMISALAPFGEGNAEPLFWVQGLTVQSARTVGKTDKHLKIVFSLPEGSDTIDAIAFGYGGDADKFSPGVDIDVLAHLSHNGWMGNRTVQLMVQEWKYEDKDQKNA